MTKHRGHLQFEERSQVYHRVCNNLEKTVSVNSKKSQTKGRVLKGNIVLKTNCALEEIVSLKCS